MKMGELAARIIPTIEFCAERAAIQLDQISFRHDRQMNAYVVKIDDGLWWIARAFPIDTLEQMQDRDWMIGFEAETMVKALRERKGNLINGERIEHKAAESAERRVGHDGARDGIERPQIGRRVVHPHDARRE